MHAVRGTIGYDPNLPDPKAKQASRERFFEGLGKEARDTAGAIERNVKRTEAQRQVDSRSARYDEALAHLDQAVAELDAPKVG